MYTAWRPLLLWVFFCISQLVFAQVDKPLVPVAALPFDWYNGHMYIQVAFDSAGTQTLLFDTGTPGLYLYRDYAAKMGYKIKKQKRQLSVRDSLDYGHIKAVNCQLNNVTIQVKQVKVYQPTHFARFEGRKVAGAIGTALLDAFVVGIDYSAQQLLLYDRDTYEAPDDYYTISIKTYNGVPVLPVVMKEGSRTWKHRLLLHTGFNGSLAITERTARKNTMYDPYDTYWYGYHMVLPGHIFPARQISMASVTLLGVTWSSIPTLLVRRSESLVDAPKWVDGIIGNNLMAGFSWLIDTKADRLYVRKEPSYKPLTILSWTGMRLTTTPDGQRMLVYDVLPDSPAAKAGIKEGDEVIAIYEQPTTDLALYAAEQLMGGAAKLLQVHIKQGKTIYEKIFRLQPLTPPGANN